MIGKQDRQIRDNRVVVHTFQFKLLVKVHVASDDTFKLTETCYSTCVSLLFC